MSIQIDNEFESLIPRLTDEEFGQLEKNIIKDGCRDALVLWGDILVDGHNRYRICQKHNISFKTVSKDFSSRDEAIEWIILNQFGRRNMTAFQRAELALKLKSKVEAKAKERQIRKPSDFVVQKSAPQKSRDELASIAGVSHDTLKKAEVIKKEGTPEQIQRAREGGKGNTVNAVFREIMEAKADPAGKKVCAKCGAEQPLTDFYPGRNVCKSCINAVKSYHNIKGDVISTTKEVEELGKKYEDKIISDLYDQSREIVYGIDDMVNDLKAISGTFIRQTGGCLQRNQNMLDDQENAKKIMTVLSEAETAIKEIRKEFLHEQL